MRISYSIRVTSGKRSRKWSNNIKDEGKEAIPTEHLSGKMYSELKSFLREIEEAYPDIKNKNTSLDEHF